MSNNDGWTDVAEEGWSDVPAMPTSKLPKATNRFDQWGVAQQQTKQPTSLLNRVATGTNDILFGGAQLADKIFVDPFRKLVAPNAQNMTDVVNQRESEYVAPEGVDWGRMGGNLLNPTTLMGGGSGSVLKSALAGAGQSALQPTPGDNYWEDKAVQASTGAGIGTLAGAAGKGIGTSDAAKVLMKNGVQPSAGQAGNPLANVFEKVSAFVPGLGFATQHAQNRPIKEFSEKAIGMVTDGKATTVRGANKLADDLYNESVPFLTATPESKLNVKYAMRDAKNNPELSADGQKILLDTVTKRFANIDKLDGPGLKELDAQLGQLGRKYGKSMDSSQHALSDEFFNVQTALREGFPAGMPTEEAAKLARANKMYKDLIPVNKAIGKRTDELLLPQQYKEALAKAARKDPTRMKPNEFVDAAAKVLPRDTQDATQRMLMGIGAGGGLGLMGATNPASALLTAGLGTSALAGSSRLGQRVLMGNTAPQKFLSKNDARIAQIIAASLRGNQNANE